MYIYEFHTVFILENDAFSVICIANCYFFVIVWLFHSMQFHIRTHYCLMPITINWLPRRISLIHHVGCKLSQKLYVWNDIHLLDHNWVHKSVNSSFQFSTLVFFSVPPGHKIARWNSASHLGLIRPRSRWFSRSIRVYPGMSYRLHR